MKLSKEIISMIITSIVRITFALFGLKRPVRPKSDVKSDSE